MPSDRERMLAKLDELDRMLDEAKDLARGEAAPKPEPRKWKAGDRVVVRGTVESHCGLPHPVVVDIDHSSDGNGWALPAASLAPEGDLVSLAKVREIVEAQRDGQTQKFPEFSGSCRNCCHDILNALARAFPEAKP